MILIRATQLVLLCHPLSFPEASPETLCSSASVPESEACWLGKICVLFPTRDSNGTRAREGGGGGRVGKALGPSRKPGHKPSRTELPEVEVKSRKPAQIAKPAQSL